MTRKLAELHTLSEENEMLKLRSAVLEAVTSGREYHVSIIIGSSSSSMPLLEIAEAGACSSQEVDMD